MGQNTYSRDPCFLEELIRDAVTWTSRGGCGQKEQKQEGTPEKQRKRASDRWVCTVLVGSLGRSTLGIPRRRPAGKLSALIQLAFRDRP